MGSSNELGCFNFIVKFLDVLEFSNRDLKNIVTPVKVNIYKRLLQETGYDKDKIQYLVNGFTHGFDLCYKGPSRVRKKSPNLKLTVGSTTELWNKIMTEVKAKRYAGPFKKIPYKYFIQSPVGLVPKDKGKKTRLIFHLSYPKTGESVNSCIPEELCTVQYPDFMDAVTMCIEAGPACHCAKSDMSMAFRNIPLNKRSWCFLILKATHPVTGVTYYFVDKCLPFGASISCAIFQEFSNSIAYLVKSRTHKSVVNYLDDFFFAALCKAICNSQVQVFLDICNSICFPVSLEKTFWGVQLLTFLGLLIDTINQKICIPLDKLQKAIDLVQFVLNKKNKKITLKQLQNLTGFLNFLCKCIVPGRTFLRRLYSLEANDKLLPHHHIRITAECRMDMEIWMRFLSDPLIYCRPFLSCIVQQAKDIDMYSDASGSSEKGFGAYCGQQWIFRAWDKEWMESEHPSIEYLELYAVAMAILIWIKNFKNSSIELHCDNESVCKMVNKSTSTCKNCMVLLRIIVLECLIHNVHVTAEWVSTGDNGKADALSRLELGRFRTLSSSHNMSEYPVEPHEDLWPITKIWLKN